MKKPFLKFNLSGFGLADEHPFELSVNEVLNLIEIQQLEEHSPGQILELIKGSIKYLKGLDSELVKVLLKEVKDSI